jgi:hypothetical protein
MVVGMLAFGGKWDSLVGLDPTGMYPIKVAEDHAAHAAKKVSHTRSGPDWMHVCLVVPAFKLYSQL